MAFQPLSLPENTGPNTTWVEHVIPPQHRLMVRLATPEPAKLSSILFIYMHSPFLGHCIKQILEHLFRTKFVLLQQWPKLNICTRRKARISNCKYCKQWWNIAAGFWSETTISLLSGAINYSDISNLVSDMVKTVLIHMKISPGLKLLAGISVG